MKTPLRFALPVILNVLCINGALSQTLSGVVNSYYAISAIAIPSNVVTVDNAAGLYNGQPVLIIQMKGATISSVNSAAYGNVTAIGDAGNYEFNTICSITGNQVMLQNKLVNAYDPTGNVQLVSYNSYTSVTVNGTINAQAWDPTTGKGGVVVIAATSTITLNADIDVSGQGFQGGALINYAIPPYNCDWATAVNGYFYNDPGTGDYTAGTKGEGIAAMIANEPDGMGKLANGGGGGNNANSGGAGGGNYGAGGNGGTRAGETFFSCHGQYPGIGGASVAAYGYTTGANRIFMGGGGGSGEENNGVGEPGANGGGIIILSAPTIAGGGGQLLANGLQPTNAACQDPLQAEGDGGGGGGAGGTIIIDATTITGAINASAVGGAGSNSSNRVNDCTGPGGGGGGGMVWAAGASFPAAVTATVTGGANGVVSSGNTKVACRGSANGATSGATGLAQSGYAAPLPGAAGCSVLASTALESFTAMPSADLVALAWRLSSDPTVSGIRNFILERATDSSGFLDLATVAASAGTLSYRYSDPAQNITGRVAYRLAWQDLGGVWWYSRIVEVTLEPGPGSAPLILQPNPARDQLTLTIYSRTGEFAGIVISDVVGQSLLSQRVLLHQGVNTVTIPLREMSQAVYFLSVDMESGRQVREFIKK
ncbi:MAG TPA: T9SS type A sorting domain-containing protein [Puia sp.]|nr:T9SS type A sorting domain-containing protein [Puia sp.]